MKLPEYVTVQEVGRVCKELGIRDWARMKKPGVTTLEAGKILRQMDTRGLKVDLEQFRSGLEVELEHGLLFKKYNVTNNHPMLTGKIVMAHFMESLDYYRRLEVAELEGDLMKAVAARDARKTKGYYKRVSRARQELAAAEHRQL